MHKGERGHRTLGCQTLVTMGIILSVYDLDDIDLFLVSGDDSLIFSSKPLKNKTDEINRDFGFEAKMIENSVPYFCSKYIISDRGKIRVVPDPVRFLRSCLSQFEFKIL